MARGRIVAGRNTTLRERRHAAHGRRRTLNFEAATQNPACAMDYTTPARIRPNMPTAVAQSLPATPGTRPHKYRPVLLALAVLLAAATILYSAAWMYYIRHAPPQVEIGIDVSYRNAGVEIDNVRRSEERRVGKECR